VTGKLAMRNSILAVLKNMDAEEMVCASDPVDTSKDQMPIADCDNKADLNKFASSGTNFPEAGHFDIGMFCS
jgi:hypothetical protein